MLTRPTLLTKNAFDASQEQIFYFTAQPGGSQIVANQLTIRDQSDNRIIYQNIQNSFKYQHILPADTLANGGYYNATIVVIDNQGNQSVPSYYIQFRCYSTPELKFTNIPEANIINNASYNFEFNYNQAEGEMLNSYSVQLYDASQILISSSGTVYITDGNPPYYGSYLFAGFEDKSIYYIEIVGETVHGSKCDSGKIRIDINYVKPDLFTLLTLKNNCDAGSISITSNIILVSGSNYPDPPKFIDNKEIDLTGDGYYVTWDKGYSFSDDFLMRAWFRKPNDYSEIVRFSNIAGQTISIRFMKGYENIKATSMKAYVQVYVSSLDGIEYYIYSNYIYPIADTKYYNLQFKRENGIYQVELLMI